MRVVAGLFVGGASRRMGGVPKGLIEGPDGRPIVVLWRDLFDSLGVPCVLVGAAEAYAHFRLEAIADDPPGCGPLGGLVALLAHAGEGRAIAVACDMPYVGADLVRRLLDAPSAAPIVAPRRDGRWEPFFSRHDAPRVLPAAARRAREGRLSLRGLLDEVGADELRLGADQAALLGDWDTPDDVRDGVSRPRRSP